MFLLWTISFLLGSSTLNILHVLPNLAWLYVVIVINAFFCSFSKGMVKNGLWLSLGYFLGVLWISGYATFILKAELPKELEGKTQVITGTISSIPEQRGRGIRFEFTSKERKLLLTWYGYHPKLDVGDKWRLAMRLKRPHGEVNKGGFDYEKWLFSKRILATGYVVKSKDNQLIGQSAGFYLIDRFRQRLSEKMTEILPDNPMLPFIKALTIGERTEVTTRNWAVLSQTGTNHLLAISGLHVGFIAGLVFLLWRFLWARLGLGRFYPAPIIAAMASILAAFTYSALAGFALPTQRALIMVIVVMLGVIIKRKVSLWHTFGLALFFILLLDPLAPLSMSFWLSFSAVMLLMYGVSGRLHQNRFWWKWVRPQWVIFVGLMPLLWFFFQQSSLVAFAANTVAIPFVGFLVVPLSLISVGLIYIAPFIAEPLLHLATQMMGFFWPFLQYLADSPIAVWQLHKVHGVLFIALLAGALLLLAPKKTPGRWLALIYFLPLFLLTPLNPKPQEYWVTVFDIGQGLAVMVRTEQHTMVYDAGLPWTNVANFLNAEEIRELDLLMISHEDSDHAGGVEKLISIYPPKKTIREKCNRGQSWVWDGVRFTVLHPKKASQIGNDDSCVLLIDNGEYRTLLPGDIEKKAEKELITHYQDLKVDVLVAPHHGSNTSSTKNFLKAIAPQYVIFATGYRNRYRFPTKKVVSRYEKQSAEMFNTATQGAIMLKLPKNAPLNITSARKLYRRVWQQ